MHKDSSMSEIQTALETAASQVKAVFHKEAEPRELMEARAMALTAQSVAEKHHWSRVIAKHQKAKYLSNSIGISETGQTQDKYAIRKAAKPHSSLPIAAKMHR